MRVSSSTCVLLQLMLEILYANACAPKISGSSSIEVGNSKTFTCSYNSCTTKRIITWKVNEKTQSNNTFSVTYSPSTVNNDTVYSGSSSFTYIPSRPSSSDSNRITVKCLADSTSNSINVNILYGPDVVTLNATGTFNITEGNSSPHISCQSTCNPTCTNTFHKGELSSTVATSVFYIYSVSRGKSGQYKCTANNTVSSRKSTDSFELNVQYPPAFSLSLYPSSTVEEGTSVSFVFELYTSGNPPDYNFQQCSHYVNNTFLRHIPYSSTTSEVRFTIQNVSITDRGRYTCNVTNRIPNSKGDISATDSSELKVKTPPLILMETKNVRFNGENYTLSVDFISLLIDPEVHWVRIREDQTGERTKSYKLYSTSYNVTKDNVTFNIPSYATELDTKDSGRYVLFVKNSLGTEVVEYMVGLKGNDMDTGASTAMIASGSVFLVLGVLGIAMTGFLLYKIRNERKKLKKAYRENHKSLYILPSANELTPGFDRNGENTGEVNPSNDQLRIEDDGDSSPSHLAPDPPSLFDEKKEGNTIYENNTLNQHSGNKYVPVPSKKPAASSIYEIPRIITQEEIKLKLQKNPHPYANEKSAKPKTSKKPKFGKKSKDYANVSFKTGGAYENHELRS